MLSQESEEGHGGAQQANPLSLPRPGVVQTSKPNRYALVPDVADGNDIEVVALCEEALQLGCPAPQSDDSGANPIICAGNPPRGYRSQAGSHRNLEPISSIPCWRHDWTPSLEQEFQRQLDLAGRLRTGYRSEAPIGTVAVSDIEVSVVEGVEKLRTEFQTPVLAG